MQEQVHGIPRSSCRKKCIRSCKNVLCWVNVLQSCPTLCNPMDCVPPGSSAHGILQARILEWVAMPSSRGLSQPRDQTHVSYVFCIGRQVLYHYRHLRSPGYSPATAAAKSRQSCLTLCDPIDGSPPGSPSPGILQARTLEWVAISFSNAWKWKVKVKSLSRVRLLATPWTAPYQTPPSVGFSRQEYWSGVPLPSLSRRHRGPQFALLRILVALSMAIW